MGLRANLDKAQGRAKLGVEVFAESLLVVPKALAENSGHDAQDVIIKMREALTANPDAPIGFDIHSGDVLEPESAGIIDTYLSKRHMISTAPVIANQLLLVDEILRAGRKKGVPLVTSFAVCESVRMHAFPDLFCGGRAKTRPVKRVIFFPFSMRITTLHACVLCMHGVRFKMVFTPART